MHFYRRRPIAQLPKIESTFGLHNTAIVAQFPLLKQIIESVSYDFTLVPDIEGSKVFANSYFWIKTVPLSISESGRAFLNDGAFDEASMQIRIPDKIYSDEI